MSDARELVELHGHTLPWNRENGNESAYRFVLNAPAVAPAADEFQLTA